MRIGIDLGGTKIECIVLDDKGSIKRRQRVDTPQGDYVATLKEIVNLVLAAEQEFDHTMTVGIGTPGALSPSTHLLRNSNSVCLNQQPVLQDLEQALNRQLRIANDADCFTLSEAVDGAGCGANIVFGVIIGTGVGGGVVVRQQLLAGPNAIAGEWGHNPMPWLDQNEVSVDCYCGQRACIETFLSGAGLERAYANLSGKALSCLEIVTLAENKNAIAEQVLSLYELFLARALAQIINVLDPDVIVLGGGISNIDRLYKNVHKLWPPFVFSEQVLTRLRKAKYGDSSGVRGAAWLWPIQN